MTSLSHMQDRLEAIRAHRGTVRISFENHPATADVLGTEVVKATTWDTRDELLAFFRINAEAKELVALQQSVINYLMAGEVPHATMHAPERVEWHLEESIEVITNERGLMLWTIHMRYRD